MEDAGSRHADRAVGRGPCAFGVADAGRTASEGLLFTIRTEGGQRIGVWSGRLSGVLRVVHGFRVQTTPLKLELPLELPPPPPAEVVADYTGATKEERREEQAAPETASP